MFKHLATEDDVKMPVAQYPIDLRDISYKVGG